MEGFYRKKKGGHKGIKRVDNFKQGHLSSEGRGFVRKIMSLALIRKFQTGWLKVLLLGETETAWIGTRNSWCSLPQ